MIRFLGVTPPEYKTKESKVWYVSMGSGAPIADPFLGFLRHVFWPDKPPPLSEGKFYVCLALDHVIHLNTGGIKGPKQVAEIRKDKKDNFKASIVDDIEMNDHTDNVRSLYDYIRGYLKKDEKSGSKKPVLSPE